MIKLLRFIWTIVLTIGLISIAVPASAATLGNWSTPSVDLSEAGGDATWSNVVTDASGNVTAIWSRFNGANTIIQSATRSVGGTWPSASDISTSGRSADEPEVAVDASGNVTAVWVSNGIVQSASRSITGTWSPVTDLSSALYGGDLPQIAVDAAGNATAIWYRGTGSSTYVQTAHKPFGGTWSVAVDISDVGGFIPQLALDAAGNVTAVWSRSNGSNFIVQSRSRAVGGSWSSVSDLSSIGVNAYSPQVASDSAGNVTVVWVLTGSPNWTIQSAFKATESSWQPTVTLSTVGGDADQAQIAVDTSGNFLSVWVRASGGSQIVQSSSRNADGSWSPVADLSALGGSSYSPQVAFDSSGNATAIWTREINSSFIVQSASKPLGGSWSSIAELSSTSADANSAHVAVDSVGHATAVWVQSNGSNTIVQSASMEWTPELAATGVHSETNQWVAGSALFLVVSGLSLLIRRKSQS